ncbi:restriction endonuclease [Candidatus Kaiserbacteria bacterium]|nr:restriction endonuclease [Candidatus Kaiserbacteria bacterium]
MATKIPTIQDVVRAYNLLMRHIEDDAHDGLRAYGGIIRAGKGALVESLARNIIEIAWHNLGGKATRLSFDKKPILVPIKKQYIDRIKDQKIRTHILKNIRDYVYKFKTDVHVNVDNKLVMGVECKAYTENAMIKRIAVDGMFLKQSHPKALNVLFQLESQLGGDYGDIKKDIHYGSNPTHTILSYFDDVDLNIITLLDGERKVDRPIHKRRFYKRLRTESVKRAVKVFEDMLGYSL